VQPGGLYEDHVLHRPSGEVHLPDMVKFKCPLGGLGRDPDHELAARDAGEHTPVQEEGKAAEHLALGYVRQSRPRQSRPRLQHLP
jgi:hypothetical protein